MQDLYRGENDGDGVAKDRAERGGENGFQKTAHVSAGGEAQSWRRKLS